MNDRRSSAYALLVIALVIVVLVLAALVLWWAPWPSAGASPATPSAVHAAGPSTLVYQRCLPVIIPVTGSKTSADVLNDACAAGWHVASIYPLAGSDGTHFMGIAVLERSTPPPADDLAHPGVAIPESAKSLPSAIQ